MGMTYNRLSFKKIFYVVYFIFYRLWIYNIIYFKVSETFFLIFFFFLVLKQDHISRWKVLHLVQIPGQESTMRVIKLFWTIAK